MRERTPKKRPKCAPKVKQHSNILNEFPSILNVAVNTKENPNIKDPNTKNEHLSKLSAILAVNPPNLMENKIILQN